MSALPLKFYLGIENFDYATCCVHNLVHILCKILKFCSDVNYILF